jgi:hypothetical protein
MYPDGSSQPSGVFRLEANGLAIWTAAGGKRVLGSWRLEHRDRLVLGMWAPSKDSSLGAMVNKGLYWFGNTRLANFDGHMDVTRIDDQSFDAKLNAPWPSPKSALVTFRRLLE